MKALSLVYDDLQNLSVSDLLRKDKSVTVDENKSPDRRYRNI